MVTRRVAVMTGDQPSPLSKKVSMSEASGESELLELKEQLTKLGFPARPPAPCAPPVVPFAPLPPLPAATKRALEAEVLGSNDRYLEAFLEPNSFCPFSRGGRQRGQTLRMVHYADTADLEPFLARFVEAARDPSKVVSQLIVPLVDVTPDAWSRFCHELTALGNERLRAATSDARGERGWRAGRQQTFAVAPLHPDLTYTRDNPYSLIPLFRRTPDPTIQWVRLDALDALYEGRTGDTEYVDPAQLSAFLARPRRSPLFARIAESNMKMAERLGIPEVERTLRGLARDAQRRYARVLLDDAPRAHPSSGGCRHRAAPVTDTSPPRPALLQRGERWALTLASDLPARTPTRFLVEEVEVVAVRVDDEVHVLHGRCPHRNAPLSDALVEDERLVCPHHGWDFQLATGQSEGVPDAAVARFRAWTEDGLVWVDGAELRAWRKTHVPMFHPDDDVL
jgi:nitrite reductase (NADH) small subunit